MWNKDGKSNRMLFSKQIGKDDNHDECKGIGCITDFAVIGSYEIMSTPALMVDEKIVSMGKVLKSSDIEKFLK